MKLQQKLLTKPEVRYWADQNNLSVCNLEDIEAIVRCEFKDCLGKAFLKYLNENLTDFEKAVEYDPDTNYIVGDIVIYDCVYYEVIKEVIGIDPENSDCYCLADKFTEECLNDLWCKGSLARYLSYLVVRESIVPATGQLTNQGAVRRKGEGFEPLSDRAMERLIAHWSKKAQREFEMIHDYMKDNKECGCYDLYKGLAIKCCGKCGCKTKECECDGCKTSKIDSFLPYIC